jgi:hypothetical protein
VRHPTQRGAHHHAHAVPVLARGREPGIVQRHPGGGDAELRKAIQPLQLPGFDVIAARKIRYFSGDPGAERCGIETGDPANGGAATAEAGGEPAHSNADRSDGPDTRDDDAAVRWHGDEFHSCARRAGRDPPYGRW